uniref:Fur family transcriptional regulator n=1 Tax=Lentilactobacillus hilgardii TaxID=1588 RepID=UPI00403F50A5
MQLTFNQAVDVMRQNKLKLTHQRLALLLYLNRHRDHYINTTQIDTYMRHQYPNMSHNTVYKNIRKLKKIGIVEERFTDNHQQIKYQCDFTNPLHGHFICQNCGKVTELTTNITKLIQAELPDYQIGHQRIEIYGICPECQKKLMNQSNQKG